MFPQWGRVSHYSAYLNDVYQLRQMHHRKHPIGNAQNRTNLQLWIECSPTLISIHTLYCLRKAVNIIKYVSHARAIPSSPFGQKIQLTLATERQCTIWASVCGIEITLLQFFNSFIHWPYNRNHAILPSYKITNCLKLLLPFSMQQYLEGICTWLAVVLCPDCYSCNRNFAKSF